MKLSIAEMKKRNESIGECWFSPATMEVWGTRIVAQPNIVNIFITLEPTFDGSRHAYTLRWFDESTSRVETLGELNEYPSMDAARAARRKFTKAKQEAEMVRP